VITIEYLRSLLLRGMDLRPEKALAVLVHTLSFYKYYLFIPVFFASIILYCLLLGNWALVIRIVLFGIFNLGLLYASDYNGFLLAERHFLNIQLVSLLVILLYFFNSSDFSKLLGNARYVAMGGIAFTLGALAVTIANYKENNTIAAAEISNNEKVMEKIESTYSHKVIVLSVSTIHMIGRSFSFKNNNYGNNTYLLYDFFTYSLMPEYGRYLDSECNCDSYSPIDFFNWLAAQNALFIAEPKRFDLAEKYMRIMHNDKVKFLSPVNVTGLAGINDYTNKDCELRTVVVEK
jgi:hypothetical protein